MGSVIEIISFDLDSFQPGHTVHKIAYMTIEPYIQHNSFWRLQLDIIKVYCLQSSSRQCMIYAS